ncbi:hypothetical protein GGG16DRAFT_119957 [Schizophyllum commune]
MAELERCITVVRRFLESNDSSVRRSAAQALDDLAACFSPEFKQPALPGSPNNALRKIFTPAKKALDSIAYAKAIPQALSIASLPSVNIQYRPAPRAPTAAQTLTTLMIKRIGDLHTQKNSEYREAVDSALSTAMRALGLHALLDTLPLNLKPEDRSAGREFRAYLPQMAESAGRSSEAKVWSVLVAQARADLPGYCAGATDLKEGLSQQFRALLLQLLYMQSELLPSILRALKTLVESNILRAESKEFTLGAISKWWDGERRAPVHAGRELAGRAAQHLRQRAARLAQHDWRLRMVVQAPARCELDQLYNDSARLSKIASGAREEVLKDSFLSPGTFGCDRILAAEMDYV